MMPEPPDFDQIAFEALGPELWTEPTPTHVLQHDAAKRRIAEQLRQVWNARGAADAHAVEEKLATLTGWVSSEPYRQHLKEAIEALNRA